MPGIATVGRDQSADLELLLVFHGGVRRRLVSPLGASAVAPVVRMGIAGEIGLIGRRHLMVGRIEMRVWVMRPLMVSGVVKIQLAGHRRGRRRRWRRPLRVVPGRQTVNGGGGVMVVVVGMVRRRRTVTHRTSAGTHDATDDARVMRMVRMVGRREHGETFVKRKHFYLFCLV